MGILFPGTFQGKAAKGKITVMPYVALRRPRKEDCEIRASLDHTVKLCQKKRKQEGRELALI